MPQELTGTMGRWNSDKGFGFIQPSDGQENIFCHVSDLLGGEGSVQEGDKVAYEEEYDDRKGKYRAVRVEVIERGRGGGGRERSRSRGGGGGYDRRGGGGGGGGQESRPGDWDCPECGAMNFARRSSCFKCQAPKPLPNGGGRDRDDRRGGGGRDYDRDDRGGRGGRDYDRDYRDDRGGGRDYDRAPDRGRDYDRDDRRGGGGRGYDDRGGRGGDRDYDRRDLDRRDYDRRDDRGGGRGYDDRGGRGYDDRGSYGRDRDYDDRGRGGGDRYDDRGRGGGDRYDDRRRYDDRGGGGNARSEERPRKRTKWDDDDTPAIPAIVPQTDAEDLPEWLQDLASAQLQGKSTDGIGPPPPGTAPPFPAGPPPGAIMVGGSASALSVREMPNSASPMAVYGLGIPGVTNQEYKRLQIPASIVGALIGKGGEGIAKLRTASQADIKLHHGEGEPFGIITISGNIEVAEKVVKDRIEEIQRIRSPDHFETAFVDVPQELVGQVIGAAGCNIQIMQSKSGCKIGFVNLSEIDPSCTEDRQICRIRGSADKMAKAKEIVLDQVEAVKQFRDRKKKDELSSMSATDPRAIALRALEAGKAGKGSKARLIANAQRRMGMDPEGKGCGGTMAAPTNNAPVAADDGAFRWPELQGGGSPSLPSNDGAAPGLGLPGLGKGLVLARLGKGKGF
mmetsp:Transcript_127604/g.234843  ORF Transcript_127604/g.234843 Transcript_127604/m.234843 type:complete len:676 (+) Transcript_127604:96-2123(+)